MNGTVSDVTRKYTDTGHLVVKVERDRTPIENVKVIVKSRFLMENLPESYKEPQFVVEDYTSSNGSRVFDLGANNYTVVAQIANERAESNVSLLENTSQTVVLHLEKSGTPFYFPSVFLLFLLVFTDVLIILLASIFTYCFVLRVLAKRQQLPIQSPQ